MIETCILWCYSTAIWNACLSIKHVREKKNTELTVKTVLNNH